LRHGNRVIARDRGALLGLGEAGTGVRGIGSRGWCAQGDQQEDGSDAARCSHGRVLTARR